MSSSEDGINWTTRAITRASGTGALAAIQGNPNHSREFGQLYLQHRLQQHQVLYLELQLKLEYLYQKIKYLLLE
jgi:hypothetical protein